MELAPLALIARLAALVPPPKRHLVRYFGIISSYSSLRDQVVPASTAPPASPAEPDTAKKTSRYIGWSELLQIEILCKKCKAPLRLIALIKSEDTAKKILTAMHLPSEIPNLHPARSPPGSPGVEGGKEQAGESWLCAMHGAVVLGAWTVVLGAGPVVLGADRVIPSTRRRIAASPAGATCGVAEAPKNHQPRASMPARREHRGTAPRPHAGLFFVRRLTPGLVRHHTVYVRAAVPGNYVVTGAHAQAMTPPKSEDAPPRGESR